MVAAGVLNPILRPPADAVHCNTYSEVDKEGFEPYNLRIAKPALYRWSYSPEYPIITDRA